MVGALMVELVALYVDDLLPGLARSPYLDPIAADTNDRKLSGLKPHTFIIFQFYTLAKARRGSHCATFKTLPGPRFFPAENAFPCLFRLLEAPPIPQLTGLQPLCPQGPGLL